MAHVAIASRQVPPQPHALHQGDHVLDALMTMNGKRDALAIVATPQGQQFKVMTLFQRFITLFRFSKTERETLFNAQEVVSVITARLQNSVPDFSLEQQVKIRQNLNFLNHRLNKKSLNLNAAIERFNRISNAEEALHQHLVIDPVVENSPQNQVLEEHPENNVEVLLPPQAPVERNVTAPEFSARLKRFKSTLKPYISLKNGGLCSSFLMDYLAHDQALKLLQRSLKIFRQGGKEHATFLHHETKFDLIKRLEILAYASVGSTFDGIPEARAELWVELKALAATLPMEGDFNSDYERYARYYQGLCQIEQL